MIMNLPNRKVLFAMQSENLKLIVLNQLDFSLANLRTLVDEKDF